MVAILWTTALVDPLCSPLLGMALRRVGKPLLRLLPKHIRGLRLLQYEPARCLQQIVLEHIVSGPGSTGKCCCSFLSVLPMLAYMRRQCWVLLTSLETSPCCSASTPTVPLDLGKLCRPKEWKFPSLLLSSHHLQVVVDVLLGNL